MYQIQIAMIDTAPLDWQPFCNLEDDAESMDVVVALSQLLQGTRAIRIVNETCEEFRIDESGIHALHAGLPTSQPDLVRFRWVGIPTDRPGFERACSCLEAGGFTTLTYAVDDIYEWTGTAEDEEAEPEQESWQIDQGLSRELTQAIEGFEAGKYRP